MGTSKGLIGVIVPVYKVEKYIAECIESIIEQTYTNFRLILVDDGTPDNAGKICDEYAKKDSRITVIHQENAGVTHARARGVEEANDCEWITFVDGDDTISTQYLSEFYKAINNDVDIVINEVYILNKFLPKEEYLHLLISVSPFHCLAPWNKLFRREIFTKFVFDIPKEIIVGEDLVMNIRLVFNSNQDFIRIINKQIYNYRQTSHSVTHKHIKTPKYESIFNEVIIKSIPQDKLFFYIQDTIKHRLRHFFVFWGYRYHVKGMKVSNFYKRLSKDIKTYKYRLSFIDRIIFNYQNPIIRFIAINIKRTKNILTNKDL